MHAHRLLAVAVAAASLALPSSPAAADDAAPAPAAGEAPAPKLDLHWTEGPTTVSLGSVAEIKLPDWAVFLGPEETRKLLEHWGNVTDGDELGMVAPKADDQDWIIVFEFDDVGYVKDADKEKIDAAAILKNLQEGAEQGNAERKKRGHPGMHVTGWAEPPHYDPRTHNLTWAALHRMDDGDEGVNYNVRLLGRAGVMRVTLVDEPGKLQASKPWVEKVISAFAFKQGKSYAEWVPGDKVAEYGLTALVAAGAGAAAAKLGFFGVLGKLFAKFAKLLVVAGAALLGGLVKLWNALRGKAPARKPQAFPPHDDPPAGGPAGA